MALWECERSVFLMAIMRTIIGSWDPYGLCFLSLFSIDLNSSKRSEMSSIMVICMLSWLFLAVWFDVNVVSGCVFYFHVAILCVKMGLYVEVCGGMESELKWAQRLMWWMFDKFPLKVCVWSGSECIFYLLWIKGKTEIKLNLTRYNILFTVTFFFYFMLIELPTL